eukprot:2046100-Rhodomonas_salina.2
MTLIAAPHSSVQPRNALQHASLQGEVHTAVSLPPVRLHLAAPLALTNLHNQAAITISALEDRTTPSGWFKHYKMIQMGQSKGMLQKASSRPPVHLQLQRACPGERLRLPSSAPCSHPPAQPSSHHNLCTSIRKTYTSGWSKTSR